jgi:spermidine/putrescine transport system permease protein
MAERGDDGKKRARFAPYLLLSPGSLWLILFFVVPLWTLARMALSSKPSRFADPTFDWHWSNISDAFNRFGPQFFRSFEFAFFATVFALIIGYPLAYVIATRGGRFKNLLLGLVVVPFFTTYLIRTFAWKTILADDGPFVSFVRWAHLIDLVRAVPLLGHWLLPSPDRILATPAAVIGGLTYNLLPFMVLPIYVAIEKIDLSLVDAAKDLYNNGWQAFRKVIFPLSIPGVFAGSLLTFIPAAGDYVNAYYLGLNNRSTQVIGSVVQNQYLNQNDYPLAAAISFIFMVIVTIAVLIYARSFGTEDLV